MTERMIIIDAVLKVVMVVVTAVLIPAIKGSLDRNRDNKEIALVLAMADIAVRSVADDLKTEEGAAKKEEALARLAAQIEGWGVKGFTKTELDHYIGTAYTQMKEAKLAAGSTPDKEKAATEAAETPNGAEGSE